MRHDDLNTFWMGLGVYAAALALCAAILAASQGLAPGLAALCAGLSACGLVGLFAHPLRMIAALRLRLGRICRVDDDLNAHLPASHFQTFDLGLCVDALGAEGSATLSPAQGVLDHLGATSAPEGSRLSLAVNQPTPDKRATFTLALEDPQGRPVKAITGRFNAAKLPKLTWACWRLCDHKGWHLSTPFGSLRHESPPRTTLDRVRAALQWARGDKLTPDDDERRAPERLADVAPLCDRDTPDEVAYGFPDGAPSEEAGRADADLLLRRLALACIMGIATAPLAILVHHLRVRPVSPPRRSLTLSRSAITLDGRAEALGDLLLVTAFPVHAGPPLILTRRDALLVGGLDDYDRRIAWGRHVLERTAALLGDARYDGVADTIKPFDPLPHDHLPDALKWRKSITFMRVAVALLGALILKSVFVDLMDFWSYVWFYQIASIRFAPVVAAFPWNLVLFGAFGLFLLLPLLDGLDFKKRLPLVIMALALLPLTSIASYQAKLIFVPGGQHMPLFEGTHERPPIQAWLDYAEANKLLLRRDLTLFDMSGADLNSMEMSWSDMSGVNAIGVNLRGAQLFHLQATGARLDRAALARASMTAATFSNANLTGADLTHAFGDHANFDGALLKDANLSNATLNDASFSQADLQSADLRGADLRSANLAGADLTAANLGSANLAGANLVGARLDGADLQGAILTFARFDKGALDKATLSPSTLCLDGQPAGPSRVCADPPSQDTPPTP